MEINSLGFNFNFYTLVKGDSGLIGTNLCELLLNNSNHVTCLDDFFTRKRNNTSLLLSNQSLLLVEGDIFNLESYGKAREGMDYVVHQIALSSIPRSINCPFTSKGVSAVYNPSHLGDVPYSLALIDKTKQLLGYSPQFNIKTGLKQTVS